MGVKHLNFSVKTGHRCLSQNGTIQHQLVFREQMKFNNLSNKWALGVPGTTQIQIGDELKMLEYGKHLIGFWACPVTR
jgi:hypothetical protein